RTGAGEDMEMGVCIYRLGAVERLRQELYGTFYAELRAHPPGRDEMRARRQVRPHDFRELQHAALTDLHQVAGVKIFEVTVDGVLPITGAGNTPIHGCAVNLLRVPMRFQANHA